jgi:signal peptidase I
MKPENKTSSNRQTSALFDWADALVSALIFIVLLFSLVFRMTGVIGTSMVPTLNEGDRLIISKLFYTPKPGDIVVISKESFQKEPIVKRVIAVGGQTVDIDFNTGSVYVDGVLKEEPYINEKTSRSADVVFPLDVPPGKIFVMGDNRNYSTDSRASEVGLIDMRQVLGQVLFRIYPFNQMGTVQ